MSLVDNVPILQFHDAHGMGWDPVIGDDALTDPEVALPQDSAHSKVPNGRVTSTLCLDGISSTEAFTGLRIVQQGSGGVDVVLSTEVPALGGLPVSFD